MSEIIPTIKSEAREGFSLDEILRLKSCTLKINPLRSAGPACSQNQSILQIFHSAILRPLLGYSGRSGSPDKNRRLFADPRWQLYFVSDKRQSGLRHVGRPKPSSKKATGLAQS